MNDPQACFQAYGPAVGQLCRRAIQVGWSAGESAGWLAGLAGVMAGFLFAALVLVLGTRLEQDREAGPLGVGESLPVLLAGFLALLVTAMMGVIVAGLFHPLKIAPSAALLSALFAVAAVQTFVALAWVLAASPHVLAAFGTLKVAVRFVAFFSGLWVLVSVAKVQSALRGGPLSWLETVLAIAMVGAPVVIARLLVRRPDVIWDREYPRGMRFQTISFWASMALAAAILLMAAYAIERNDATVADAFPWWMVVTVLLGPGLLFALQDLTLPPVSTQAARKLVGERHKESAAPSAT